VFETERLKETRAMKIAGKPDGYGKSVSDCGDTIEIFLFVKEGTVTDAVYEADGCGFTLACAQAVAALAKGKKISLVMSVCVPERIDGAAGSLPEANKHCANLACEAMANAVSDALANLRDPWKKIYRP
jgi:nitrogen fixation protein NifU and related proteins